MKRILQKSTIGIALALVLAVSVPAMAASTCSTSACPTTLSQCLSNSQSYQDLISKLAACGMNADQLRLCGTSDTSDNQVEAAYATGGDTKDAACTEADCSANGCDAADCATSGCTPSSCAKDQCVPAQTDNAEAAAAVAPASDNQNEAVLNSVKDAISNYAADTSSCPTGTSAVQSASTCPTSSVKSASTCPTNSSDIQAAVQKALDQACSQQSGSSSCPTNSPDIQAAAQKLIDQACNQQSGSSTCNGTSSSDILNALQNSGLSACNK